MSFAPALTVRHQESAVAAFLGHLDVEGSWFRNNARIPAGTVEPMTVLEANLGGGLVHSIILTRKGDPSGECEYSAAIIKPSEKEPGYTAVTLWGSGHKGLREAFEELDYKLTPLPQCRPETPLVTICHAMEVTENLGLDRPAFSQVIASAIESNCEVRIMDPERSLDEKLTNLATLGRIRLEIGEHLLLQVRGPAEYAELIHDRLIILPDWHLVGRRDDFRVNIRA